MNLGTGNKRQMILAGVLSVVALGAGIYVYEQLFADSAPVTPQPTAVVAPVPTRPLAATAGGTKPRTSSSASLDPTLHMEAMLVSESVEYSGSGRNIFSMTSAPPIIIPKPVQPVRVNIPPPPPPLPCPPNCPPPPPPPPIDLKFFGLKTAADGTRQACLLHGDDVVLASAGDVVLRRYRVIAVDAKSVQVEDLQNNNRQTLPLLAN